MTDKEPTGWIELLNAIESVIEAADPAKRETLAQTIEAYAEDFPEDFYWAVGVQSPGLLSNMLNAIDYACRAKTEAKSRVIRLIDRKPEGNA